MVKRIMPLCCVALMCALTLAPLAQSAPGTQVQDAAQVCVADSGHPDVSVLTAADREILRAAEQTSDPSLEHLRGGNSGLVIAGLVLIFLLIIAIIR